ncbi:transcriptional regulator GcvA [Roseospira marina]|uniref:Transcriptional regulator GcvA n=1 Tax=Roseospira marina TaxID=140057 RepID=A0A5M6I7S2_9PROT|nr:transcriptional regulator GcvA [Roseospira marina]KAA5604203.1 transcriptional regulator GcvA [Roseospira marina]MBB4315699.1 LysR family glycine cleavage system transcriptional activator [Roseospira marina]MBB5088811.1 LysR family glycine cleavage system transcriptional activator [Roseospira marina]
MPPARLPPLNALRAFAAAARHLSFTRAAEDLYVTQAAVSHQVKALEDFLGVPLFRRGTRAIHLTEAGQRYALRVQDAFRTLHDATDALLAQEESGRLTVTTMTSFAAKWLIPRLGDFLSAHPEIELRLETGMEAVDLQTGAVDVALRLGPGPYPNLHAEILLRDEVFPVCAPALMDGPYPLHTPPDLAHYVLLQDGGLDWAVWLDAAGLRGRFDPYRGPGFLDSTMSIQAAVAGHGVLLGRTVLVADELADGRLIAPFDLAIESNFVYWFLCRPDRLESPRVQAFRDWVRRQTATASLIRPVSRIVSAKEAPGVVYNAHTGRVIAGGN